MVLRIRNTATVVVIFVTFISLSFVYCNKDEGDKIVNTYSSVPDSADVFEINSRLGRCMNLGNALEAPTEGEWGVTLKEEYFELIKNEGFNSVRIPIRWSAHALEESPYAIHQSFFNRIDWAIDQALQRDLLVVINIHHYEEIMSEPEKHLDRFLSLWQQISTRYKYYPIELIFEVLNEPHDALTAEIWNDYMVQAINVIRETNPTRILMVGPPDWNGIGGLSKLNVPENDTNIIVTVHYYNPFQFTHQGAGWVDGSDEWLGTTWTATPSQKQAIIDDFSSVTSWANTHNRPIYVGEFGAYSAADMNSRIAWTTYLARHLESIGFSWAYWEFCSGFGIYNTSTESWNAGLIRALMP